MEDYHDNNSLRVEDVMLGGGLYIKFYIRISFILVFVFNIYLFITALYLRERRSNHNEKDRIPHVSLKRRYRPMEHILLN